MRARTSDAPPTPPYVALAVARDDRLLATTRWVAGIVVPVLVAAFVVLYLFPGRTMRLWGWMICPEMPALVMGGGYLAGAYLFAAVARGREWHRVSTGFVATTVFSALLLATTVLHWDRFDHGHVSFWAWLLLYVSTPPLLPVLWWKNQRTDPGTPSRPDVVVPRRLRVAVGVGGALQLTAALVMFGWPHLAAEAFPFPLDALTTRTLSAFVAFPAVAWLCFLFDDRWSSFRITQHTATIGLVLVAVGAIRARGDFRPAGWQSPAYAAALVAALVLTISLQVAMERRLRLHRGGERRVWRTPALSCGCLSSDEDASYSVGADGRAAAAR